jgi:hypothetical protein
MSAADRLASREASPFGTLITVMWQQDEGKGADRKLSGEPTFA